ncbi:MAG: aspartate ammonia-lyase [Bacillota bacterium]
MKYRTEKDFLGEVNIPEDAYYGIQTARAKENFTISKQPIHKQLIIGLATVKRAAAHANMKADYLDIKTADVIMQACDQIIDGDLHDQFITDMIQGGAGTSMHMNINEVLANRASEILGFEKGTYTEVHPNDHANFGQSTNDVVPTAGKIATIRLTKKLVAELKNLHRAYLDKANTYLETVKMGRTHLQDAVPISIGQEFGAFAEALQRDIRRIESSLEELTFINMGATAVGTGLNASEVYKQSVIQNLRKLTGINFKTAPNLIDSTRNLDPFLWLSSALKTLAVNLSKTANDLRLMSSGPSTGLNEINLPQVQAGSSIMPGKVNPVIPEVINQIAFEVIGNDVSITKAVEAGQLELNVFEPIIFVNLFGSLDILKRGVSAFRTKAIEGITVNKEKCVSYVERSSGVVTALSPHIGYEKSAALAKEAMSTGQTIRELVIKEGLLTDEEIKVILDIRNMTKPGIVGQSYFKKGKKHPKRND